MLNALRHVLAGGLLCAFTVFATASDDPFDASYYFSMGSLVSGECTKLRYSVDANSWHGLASYKQDSYDPNDYRRGGRHGKLNSIVFATLVRVLKQNGPEVFCENVRKWAHRAHPRIGADLISRD